MWTQLPFWDTLLAAGEAVPGLHQPMPRAAEPACVHVCADTLLDVDSDSDVGSIELDVSYDEDERIGVLPFAARVTWAVPEFVIIFIASVGKGKRLPDREKKVMRPRGTLQDVPPPGEDSEDEDSDDDGGEHQLY